MWQLLLAAIPIMGSVPFMIHMLKNVHDRIMNPTKLALTSGGSGTELKKLEERQKETLAIEEYKASQRESYQALVSALKGVTRENGDFHIYGYLKALTEKLTTLEEKVFEEANRHQTNLIYAKYIPLLRKVVEIASSKYYGDFVRNPEHWDHPQKMREQVEAAVKAVVEEVAEDIRRVNSSRELNFQVSVESIIGSSMELPSNPTNFASVTSSLMGEILEGVSAANKQRMDSMDNIVAATNAELQKSREEYKAKVREAEAKETRSNEIATLNAEIRKQDAAITRMQSSIQGGSRDQIARHEDSKDGGEERFTKTVNSMSYTLLKTESKDPKRRFIASSLDTITSAYKSEHFTNEFDGAMWVDKRILENQKQHPYRNHCKYCEDVKVDSPSKSA